MQQGKVKSENLIEHQCSNIAVIAIAVATMICRIYEHSILS